jgi:folate-binding protein YgfZ
MYSDEGYQALTKGAGFVVRSDRGVLRVTGADRASWLQGLLTNDIDAVRPGEAAYAAYLTPQGRMISDMRVVAVSDAALLDVPEPLAATLRDRMDNLIFAEDVQALDVSSLTKVIEVHGPASGDVVRNLDPSGSDGQRGSTARLAAFVRDDQFGMPGWAIYVPRDDAPMLTERLATLGAPEVPLDTLEVVRIEAGIPRFLVDMTEDTIPLEAGIEDRAISMTKGCYVGQEIIVRVLHRGGGRVARRLVGLSFGSDHAGMSGDDILSGDRTVGHVTSVAWSPALGHAIALGYVHRDFVEPGTPLDVASGDLRLRVTVAALPFVSRPA